MFSEDSSTLKYSVQNNLVLPVLPVKQVDVFGVQAYSFYFAYYQNFPSSWIQDKL